MDRQTDGHKAISWHCFAEGGFYYLNIIQNNRILRNNNKSYRFPFFLICFFVCSFLKTFLASFFLALNT